MTKRTAKGLGIKRAEKTIQRLKKVIAGILWGLSLSLFLLFLLALLNRGVIVEFTPWPKVSLGSWPLAAPPEVGGNIAGEMAANRVPLPSNLKIKEVELGPYVLGNEQATVTVLEFGDYRCDHCLKFRDDIFPKIKSEYVDTGKVRFVFKDLPVLGEESFLAAQAARCAYDQGKFWEYHEDLFTQQKERGDFSAAGLEKLAANLGLNDERFVICLESGKYRQLVEEEKAKAKSLGILGTPAIFVNDKTILDWRFYENTRSVIEDELKR